jgi:hypothetical protein
MCDSCNSRNQMMCIYVQCCAMILVYCKTTRLRVHCATMRFRATNLIQNPFQTLQSAFTFLQSTFKFTINIFTYTIGVRCRCLKLCSMYKYRLRILTILINSKKTTKYWQTKHISVNLNCAYLWGWEPWGLEPSLLKFTCTWGWEPWGLEPSLLDFVPLGRSAEPEEITSKNLAKQHGLIIEPNMGPRWAQHGSQIGPKNGPTRAP